MSKYWVLIAPKNHVIAGTAGGFAQSCHGKSHPLKRMSVGDGLIYYSPKLEYGGQNLCQAFTAIGQITGEDVYSENVSENFAPHRRHVNYFPARELLIKPLINQLTFIKDKEHWGNIFRFGIIRIPFEDFKLIAAKMCLRKDMPISA